MKRLKLWLVMLVLVGAGISLAFSRQVQAAAWVKVEFYLNNPKASFDPNSLLRKDKSNDLDEDDELQIDKPAGVVKVVRYLVNKDGRIGAPPRMIGRPGYTLRNTEWNSNGTVGGTLYSNFTDKKFTYYASSSAKVLKMYLLWEKRDHFLTLTYDSNSAGEIANPADRPGKFADDLFTNDDLPILERHGYSFNAWYASNGNKLGTNVLDSSTRNTPYDADPSIYSGTDHNAILIATTFPMKAEWTKKSGKVEVVYEDEDNGTVYGTLPEVDIWGEFTTDAAAKKPGYRLTGWKTPDNTIIGLGEKQIPAKLDIKLSGGGKLRLKAQWKAESVLTINYKDRDLNDIGVPSISETMDTGTAWNWNNSYEKPVADKVLVGYRLDGGDLVEGKPGTLPMTQDTTLDLIYGQDKVKAKGEAGSDGIEDFNIERSWVREDGSLVNSQLTTKIITLNKNERFTKSFDKDCDASLLKGFMYQGYYIGQDKSTLQSSTVVDFPVVENSRITYVFRQKVYDLKIHYVDFKGNALNPSEKILVKELFDSQDYIIDMTKLDDVDQKAATGWYLGAPKSKAPSLAEINDMSKAINVSEDGKTEIEITIVYDDMISVTLPLQLKFRVSDSKTKAVQSLNYSIKNESTSSNLAVKLDTKTDVIISKNTAGIRLLPNAKTDNSVTEELYLALKSDNASFGEHPLAAVNTPLTEEIASGQSINLTLAGKYYGELPEAKDSNTEFEGKLIWHFSPLPKTKK